MPLMKDDKKRVAAIIISKMKGGDSYDNMKASNEQMSHVATNDAGDELDTEPGLSAASEEIIQAVKAGSKSSLMSALKSFIEMAMMKMEKKDD